MSTEYTITGTVEEVTPTTMERDYHQRHVVVGTGGRYARSLQIRFSDKSGETAAKLDRVSVGDRVVVTGRLGRRPSAGLSGYKVRSVRPRLERIRCRP